MCRDAHFVELFRHVVHSDRGFVNQSPQCLEIVVEPYTRRLILSDHLFQLFSCLRVSEKLLEHAHKHRPTGVPELAPDQQLHQVFNRYLFVDLSHSIVDWVDRLLVKQKLKRELTFLEERLHQVSVVLELFITLLYDVKHEVYFRLRVNGLGIWKSVRSMSVYLEGGSNGSVRPVDQRHLVAFEVCWLISL